MGRTHLNPLFVTSFGPDMYHATGVHLVRSFRESQTEGTLLLCHENLTGQIHDDEAARILVYDLGESALLGEWLERNRDIIPPSLGGTAQRCRCPKPANPDVDHVRGCAWGWFNKTASRWFRKIAALDYARGLQGYDALVWLDSDCRFVRTLPLEEVDCWFGEAAAFYLKSPDREVIESGVIGFRLNGAGRRLIQSVVDRYRSGDFRSDLRWDDGYQFQLCLHHAGVPCVDLARRASAHGDVVAHSPVGRYLGHSKGIHRLLRITR